ncbi:TetR/AcrR family transcriptional regulator [Phyllobacterium sp. 0TCS1.6C]|uniref:TetR/AcrR family transcriptional regulator n=1 Tax=unclassified Phyllobacterium TaxID=2638441 RepID=UPI002264B166|nr:MULTISPECIES: TetR/AcrR family transcriptional regulator [unclassified Phyllobacterium]MCX8278865.1 TetR/AcrR family transcriptional regulator [Phyllobacterium sp. 0TCS1.6C]MCX8293649.1 TetR/AcrR family transcriptional regulator [Phyllobacterium sp. 0TCS1.6A]
MDIEVPSSLKRRKSPQQRRATATLEAIYEATIQLLVKDGLSELTTTRVAERAGVSVGTLYQYFPNKQALIYAVNEVYLDALAEKIKTACTARRGDVMESMVENLIDTYWQAKTERADVTRALYRSVVEMDNEALISAFIARTDAAAVAMFASASDAPSTDPVLVTRVILTVIFGAVRNAFERAVAGPIDDGLRQQLRIMCVAYIRAMQLSDPMSLAN